MQVKFYKVASLPTTMEPNAFYYVENGTYTESYLTNNAGVAKSVGNSSMINALVSQALANWGGNAAALSIVPDIAARDAIIINATANMMILVVDASGDSTVDSGSALYAYDFTAQITYKLAEYESMDVVLQWNNIEGRPTSTVAQIDNSVALAHAHNNKAVIDKLTEFEGGLRYDNKSINPGWATNNW